MWSSLVPAVLRLTGLQGPDAMLHHYACALMVSHRPDNARSFSASDRGHVVFLNDQSKSLNDAAKAVHCQTRRINLMLTLRMQGYVHMAFP